MPHWIVMLAAAIGAWFLLVLGGGLVVGRFLAALSRRRHHAKLPP
jgi:uncharacterized membrane protein YesL